MQRRMIASAQSGTDRNDHPPFLCNSLDRIKRVREIVPAQNLTGSLCSEEASLKNERSKLHLRAPRCFAALFAYLRALHQNETWSSISCKYGLTAFFVLDERSLF